MPNLKKDEVQHIFQKAVTDGFPMWPMGLGCINLTCDNNEIIDYAISRGVVSFDTADCYGNGSSEIALGERLKFYPRSSVYISSKGGVQFQPEGVKIYGMPSYIKAACAASLRRLQTAYLDLYYLHRVSPDIPIESSIEALKSLQEEGKIRALGLSEVSVKQLRQAHAVCRISAVQIEYAPWSLQDEQNGVINTCNELGIAVVAYSPLGRAFFTSRKTEYFENLPKMDYRRALPRYQGENLAHNIELRSCLERIAFDKNCTIAQLVLAWEIAQGVIPIPATTNPEHLDENLAALTVRLTSEDLQQMRKTLNELPFLGPRYPNQNVSAIYTSDSDLEAGIVSKKKIYLGLGFVTVLGGLFAFNHFKADLGLSFSTLIPKVKK